MNIKRSKLKVLTIVGTRPEIIRLACVMQLLEKTVEHIVVHTGQNYDYELNQIFFNDLELRKPDHFLNVNTSSLGNVLGDTLIKCEKVFLSEKPDAVLILGDTNSSIAGIIAKRLKIPVYHMEAGNRCFDFNVPEEINRRIIDHIADFNLVYTENARRHLIAEGLPQRRIYLTGSPMYEVLHTYKYKIDSSDVLNKLFLNTKKYFLVSTHREENVDNPENLKKILNFLNSLVDKFNYEVIVSTHPRTKKRLEDLKDFRIEEKVKFLKPFGFFDYVKLQTEALCTISDSGTISEESSILGFSAITIRNSMERPEALDTGSIILTGFDIDILLDSVDLVLKENEVINSPNNVVKKEIPKEYTVSNTSWRVVKLILGTAKLSNKWNSVVKL